MGGALARVGLAVALGAVTAGIGTLIPLLDFGENKNSNCNALMSQAKSDTGVTAGDIAPLIDPGTGRVAYVVVSFGGFLSIGEKLFAVPFGALKYNVTIDSYFLDVSKDRLSVAPGFDPDHWPSMADEKWNSDVHTFYECTPYWH
jgi:hypothetical protein